MKIYQFFNVFTTNHVSRTHGTVVTTLVTPCRHTSLYFSRDFVSRTLFLVKHVILSYTFLKIFTYKYPHTHTHTHSCVCFLLLI